MVRYSSNYRLNHNDLGNLAALTSDNPKRMLAYSSVAHAGYMLAAIAAVGSGLGDSSTTELVLIAIVFHLTILVLFKLGAFLVLGLLETEGRSHRLEDLSRPRSARPIDCRFDVYLHASIGWSSTVIRIPFQVVDD